MAHLLIIENWVEGTGRIFPTAINRLGHEYTFVTRNKSHYTGGKAEVNHPVLAYAKHVLRYETNNISDLIVFLKNQHRILNFDGVLTICDYYIDTVAQVAQALELPQAFSANVVNERRKHQVRAALDKARIPNPLYAVTFNWEDTKIAASKIGYPLILKPSDLASSAYVTLVNNEQELSKAFQALKSFTHNFREQAREPVWMLEEYMQGDEVSVEAVTFQGETTVIGITDKSVTGFPCFVEDGHMFPAHLAPELSQEINEYVVKVLRAIGHDHGISHTEIKITPDGPRVVEINPRPGGNYIAELVQHVTGIDLLEIHINLALNRKPNLDGLQARQGSAAIKFLVPPKAGVVEALEGIETLNDNPNIARWTMPAISNKEVFSPVDNACYLGHVVAIDKNGRAARAIAENALAKLSLIYASTAI